MGFRDGNNVMLSELEMTSEQESQLEDKRTLEKKKGKLKRGSPDYIIQT